MKKLLLIIPVLFLMLFSCKKENPHTNNIASSPVFKLIGTFGSDSIHIEVGNNAVLLTTHDTLNGRSKLNSEYQVTDGLVSNVGINVHLDEYLSFNSNIDELEIGSLPNRYHLLIEDVINSNLIESYTWVINGEPKQNQDAFLEEAGSYDIVLDMNCHNGTYRLRDKIFIGEEEELEPEFSIESEEPGHFQFSSDIPEEVDSVAWFLNPGNGQEYQYSTESMFDVWLQNKVYTITLAFYKNGQVVNYRSEMFDNNTGYPLVSMENMIDLIAEEASEIHSKGQIKVIKDGVVYVSKDNATNYSFEISNVLPYTEPFSNLELIKGNVETEIYLFNEQNDSLKLDVSGVLGFQKNPS